MLDEADVKDATIGGGAAAAVADVARGLGLLPAALLGEGGAVVQHGEPSLNVELRSGAAGRVAQADRRAARDERGEVLGRARVGERRRRVLAAAAPRRRRLIRAAAARAAVRTRDDEVDQTVANARLSRWADGSGARTGRGGGAESAVAGRGWSVVAEHIVAKREAMAAEERRNENDQRPHAYLELDRDRAQHRSRSGTTQEQDRTATSEGHLGGAEDNTKDQACEHTSVSSCESW